MHKYGTLIVTGSLILVMLLGTGCVSTSPIGQSESSLHGQTPGTIVISPSPFRGFSSSDPASVLILSPEFDGGIKAGTVTVTVEIRNFSLVNHVGRQLRPDEGHILCFKDVTPRTEPGVPAETGSGTFQISYQTSCTWYNITPGTHTFSVELVNEDNTPLVPAVIDAVDVTAVGSPDEFRRGDSG
jgi:hypothetical protein